MVISHSTCAAVIILLIIIVVDLINNKPNCAISSGFTVTYYTNIGLGFIAKVVLKTDRPTDRLPAAVVTVAVVTGSLRWMLQGHCGGCYRVKSF